MRLLSPFLLILLLAVMTVPVWGGTYFVARNGDDLGPGTLMTPWRTLSRAGAGLQPGDTVYVRAGTYSERFIPSNSGAPGNPIVYRAYPGEQVIVDGPPDDDLTVMAIYVSNIVIEGFTIKNQNYFRAPEKRTYWVALEGNAITFRKNRVFADGDPFYNIYTLNATSRGIVVAGRDITVEDCYVRGQAFGIVLAGSAPRYAIIRNDTVHATGQNNIDVGATDDGSAAYHATLIEHCVLDTSFIEDNIQFEPDYGSPVSTLHNRGTIIRNCVMGNAAENAIDLKGAGHTIIENNLIYGSSGDDDGPIGGNDAGSGAGIETSPVVPTRFTIVRGNVIWDHCSGMTMAEGDHYFNNTILNNRRTWQGSNQTDPNHTCFRAWNYPASKRAFVNNIVGGMPTGSVLEWMMDWGDKFLLDNNLYFESSGPARFQHRVSGDMVIVQGLQQWRSALNSSGAYGYLQGKEQNSREADPQFVSAPRYPSGYDPAWNFALQSTSPAIDAGRSVAVAVSGGSNSTRLAVDDAYFFCDGFGITDGDLIKIGPSSPVRIAAVNYTTSTITLAEPRTWSAGEDVHLAFEGFRPDIGAIEYKSGTVVQLPDVPTLLEPADGTTDVALNLTLSWAAADNAASYEVHVATSEDFASNVVAQSGIQDLSYPMRGLTANARYFWRVRAANGGGRSVWTSVRTFTTLKLDSTSTPPPPSLNEPVDGASGLSTNHIFTWNAVPGAVSYRIQIDPSKEFTSPAFDRSGISGTSTVIDGLHTDMTYYWRVSAASSGGSGEWSPIYRFTTFALPPSLSENAIANSNFENGTADWSFVSNGAGDFTVAAPGYRKATSAKIYITQSESSVELYQNNLVLSPDSTYRLSFAAFSSTGSDVVVSFQKSMPPYTSYGPDAERVNLTTGWKAYLLEFEPHNFLSPVNDVQLRFSFGVYGVAGDVFSLDNIRLAAVNAETPLPPEYLPVDYILEENYPNPFNPATTIRYSIPSDTHVTIKVHNLLGQEVVTLVDEFKKIGTYDVRLDLSGYATGMYLYTLSAGGFHQTRKLLYIK
ncbi:MAG: hypothetical protein H6Q31_703 [Bacteroidetes bacterium]|nr:hypothetical protein [Bacteroidota bacterium]